MGPPNPKISGPARSWKQPQFFHHGRTACKMGRDSTRVTGGTTEITRKGNQGAGARCRPLAPCQGTVSINDGRRNCCLSDKWSTPSPFGTSRPDPEQAAGVILCRSDASHYPDRPKLVLAILVGTERLKSESPTRVEGFAQAVNRQ